MKDRIKDSIHIPVENSGAEFLGFLLLIISFVVGAAFQAIFSFPFIF